MISNEAYVLELLQTSGVVSLEDMASCQEEAALQGHSTLEGISKRGLLTPDQILEIVAKDCGMEFQAEIHHVDEDVLATISSAESRRYHALPLRRLPSGLRIAIPDPLDFETLDALRYLLKTDLEPVVVPLAKLDDAIVRFFGKTDESLATLMANMDGGDLDLKKDGGSAGDEAAEGDAPIIRLVYGLILEAHRLRASDIHIEPLEKRLRLRYRIDGNMQEMKDPPKRLQSSIISRLKIMSNISIAEKRLPLDGRIALATVDGPTLDLRVSTVPTIHGESVVMRILDKKNLMLGLPELGFFADDQAILERVINYADGIFLVTGPTGSGKSTTLYACLNTINKPDRKLITVEDPVEYQLPGVNQVAVNTEIGMTFAAALRAMLRQAPNIIMVGEIRDVETASIAINASLTGHLVFSTLHTNDAPSAITRLVDMGVKPFLVSSSIRAVLAQRLIRKICPDCKQPYTPTEAELRALNLLSANLAEARFSKGHGCDRCRGTGYRGRAGIFEIFVVDDEIRHLINEGVPVSKIRQRARDLGMRVLREDGIRKVVSGMTTPEEVISATMGDKD
ncbi:MAG: type II secretion system protein E [Verrucomicrobia subdivision 6 bacterium BACL9 MAG-120924-bin69]|jgi:type IV pilus assembly protein PilB|uniref:Type II secretion system protein E n=3 Tax=Verrucomicrobia subdivision 6 TaxID=134627 RepID=A0A0R2XEF3_9BACT|nr:MAG: type II secretion system protein E [Verrucomicrobia subdivision 6 bacterium BACL9 MAG-120820-bin42]KRP34122.1 MAG: type II secretion system protein E [Verrucomicrobia subdivision 6 bacterium BACL9 MAG-120924-bin69]HCP06640.1 type II secretion system protein E [Verrucomicrobiales bacterium]